jgi:hypothetical protein
VLQQEKISHTVISQSPFLVERTTTVTWTSVPHTMLRIYIRTHRGSQRRHHYHRHQPSYRCSYAIRCLLKNICCLFLLVLLQYEAALHKHRNVRMIEKHDCASSERFAKTSDIAARQEASKFFFAGGLGRGTGGFLHIQK